MITINFIEQGKIVEVEKGTTILEAARGVNVLIESPCDAIGTCGKCKVFVKDLVNKNIGINEGRHQLKKEETLAGFVLACQAKVYEDIEVEIQNTSSQNKTLKILSDGQSFSYDIKSYITKKHIDGKTLVYGGNELLGTEPGDTTNQTYGLSIDIGTTTVVTALINMLTGEEIASTSALNPQSLHAQDVLTRIKLLQHLMA